MAENYWIGTYWRDMVANQSPPASWDGSKFVYIDPVFGDGDGLGELRLRYVGPGLGGVDVLTMPLNVIAISRHMEIRLFDLDENFLEAFLVTSVGRQTIDIPLESYYLSNFELRFRTQDDLAGLYDIEFTIGEPVRQQVFVYTMNRTGQVGAWSRYVFPFEIDDTAQLGESLFLRAGDTIYRVTEDSETDDGAPIEGIVQWPWLDFGTPGVTKMMQAVDVVGEGTGTVSLQIGYDQRSVEAFTPAYTIPIDTLTGMPVPMPVSAPTFSVRLTFNGKWSLQAVNAYLADNRRAT